MNDEQKAEWGRRLAALKGEHLQKAQVDGFLVHLLVEALDRHAGALKDAADASDKYARRLVWATWALVLATVALVYATTQIK